MASILDLLRGVVNQAKGAAGNILTKTLPQLPVGTMSSQVLTPTTAPALDTPIRIAPPKAAPVNPQAPTIKVAPSFVPNTTLGAYSAEQAARAQMEKTLNRVNSLQLPSQILSGLGQGIATTAGNAVKNVVSSFQDINKLAATPTPKYSSLGEAAIGSLKNTATNFLPTIFGAGLKAGDIPIRAATNPYSLVSDVVANAPLEDDMKRLVRPVAEATSIAMAPGNRLLQSANVLAGYATDPVSDYVASTNIPNGAKNAIYAGLNTLESAAALALTGKAKQIGKGFKAEYDYQKPAIQEGVSTFKNTGSVQDSIDSMVNFNRAREMEAARLRAAAPQETSPNVKGWTSTPQEPVQLSKAVDTTLQQKLASLEDELGLGRVQSDAQLEGKRGFLGNVLGTARELKNKAVGVVVGSENVGEQGYYNTKVNNVREAAQKGWDSVLGDSGLLGKTARTTRFLAGGTGDTQARTNARGEYKGQISLGNEMADALSKKVYELTDNNLESLSRVHSVLDPDLYDGKAAKNLTPNEAKAVDVLRKASDLINDINYSNGFITKTAWESNKGGKYIARAYTQYDFDIPEGAKKIGVKPLDPTDTGMFKSRKELDAWKKENAIKDPSWLMSKRLHETYMNDAVKKYYSYISENKNWVSATEKKGFTKLDTAGTVSKQQAVDTLIKERYGNLTGKELKAARQALLSTVDEKSLARMQNKIYGELAGKWVRNDVLEDVRGFFFANQMAQAGYQALKIFNNSAIRQGAKKIKTVYNPAVRLGNRIGNIVFANSMGVNPATFLNQYRQADLNSSLGRTLRSKGVLGTDYAKSELRQKASDLSTGKVSDSKLKKIDDKLSESYGKVDDQSKVAVAQALLDRGYSLDYAVNAIRQGMQDYTKVGKAFDISSKLPVLGKPFGKFGSNALSIMKNSMVNRPLRTMSTLMLIKLAADYASEMSGESPEDRKTRENRLGASHIPFSQLLVDGGVPLSIQTPVGEINWGRMFGLQSLNTERGVSLYDDFMSFFPVDDTLASDVLVGPALTAGGALKGLVTGEKNSLEEDFRGKSIRDPEMTAYQRDSFLPVGDQLYNVGSYLARSYAPQVLSDAFDTYRASQGLEDYYGRSKTPAQAGARLAGIKLETFGADQAQKYRDREAEYDRKDTQAKLRFDLGYVVQQGVKSGNLDKKSIADAQKAYILNAAQVSKSEIQEAKKVKKYQGIDDTTLGKVLQLNKVKTSIRSTNEILIKELIDAGKTNPARRDAVQEEIKRLVKQSNATYTDQKDILTNSVKIAKLIKDSWY